MPTNPTPKVLVVEDEPRLRDLLADVIPDMAAGFTVTTARTAEEAARILQVASHDILILDLHLPGQSGMDFFETARRTHPQVQVIIMTGFGDLAAARRAIRLDVVDFLGKPCRLDELEAALTRARQRLTAANTLPTASSTTPSGPPSATTTLEDLERQQILATLERNDGNRTLTAAELGISRRTLQYRLSQYAQQGFLID
jgi:two-component system response regulator RegA